MASSSSLSPSPCTNHRGKYDVFLSFRGEDTRDNFISHLHAALSRNKIETFIDDELKRGDEISPMLLEAIEESMILVVVLSKAYASSRWCLDELVKALECKKMNGQIVIPVFYHVNPSDVRKQTGAFGQAFLKHEQRLQEDGRKDKVQRWKTALTEVSYISGWDSSAIRSESELVDKIVKDVIKKLDDSISVNDFKGLIGIESRIKEVKSLLSIEMLDFRKVGIWGMGGIGKTTVAGVVFDQISRQFEGCCFVENVREESGKCGGLVHLRGKVISHILNEENSNFNTPNAPSFINRRFQRKKVLIVLDDVNDLKQLETLTGGIDRYGPGSRVIITTRDKQLLHNYGVDYIYEVEAFDYQESVQLLCKHAFKQDHPPNGFADFVVRVINYAEGNPLALKVVGSSLYGKSKQDLESALHKLRKISIPTIHNLLRISFDELDHEVKDIFLDTACFFKGENGYSITQILNCCYLSAQFGLSVLVHKSLIKMSRGRIQMHDLLQEMGREIVRQESIGKRSRLHYHKDVCYVLKEMLELQRLKAYG